jgi:uncharacterized protein YggE
VRPRFAPEPDEAIVWITLSAFEESPGKALGDVAQRSEALSGLLDELKVGEADRSTAGVSVQEEFDPPARGNRGLGHRASARVAVHFTDPELIGRAISRASEDLRASIDGPRWYVSPTNPVRFEAARQAAIDARSKAQAYAAGVGVKLGGLICLVEPEMMDRRRGPTRAVSGASDSRGMPIDIEEHEVRAFVDATFALVTAAADGYGDGEQRMPEQPRRHRVSLTEAQQRTPFTVLTPSDVPTGWHTDWMYIEAMQRPPAPATVVLEYRSDYPPQGVQISQSAAGERGSVFDELTGGSGWQQIVCEGAVVHAAATGHQTQAHLERAGTFVFLMSETLTVEQISSIAAGLVPAPDTRDT